MMGWRDGRGGVKKGLERQMRTFRALGHERLASGIHLQAFRQF